MKKNTKIIFGVVIFVAAAIIVVSFFYPPVYEGTSGTIGKVKKYNAGQISEKDVKLKNAMLKDEATLKLSIVQLEDYKNFLGDMSTDLGSWNKKINSLIEKDITVVKRSEMLMENSKTFSEYKTYLDKNMGTLDKTIAMLTKLHKKDTVNQNLEIEKTLNDYENFRIQVAQRFMKMIEAIPNAHNALLLNKQPGIISNKDNLTGLGVANKDGSLSSTAQNSVFNSANMILCCFSKEQMNSATAFNKEQLGEIEIANKGQLSSNKPDIGNKEQLSNVSGNKEQMGIVIPLNKEAIGFVDVVGNKQQLSNQTSANKEAIGVVELNENKQQLNNQVMSNKTMGLYYNKEEMKNIVQTNTIMNNVEAINNVANVIGLFVFNNTNNVLNVVASKPAMGVSAFNNTCPLSNILLSSTIYGIVITNKEEVMGIVVPQ